MKNPLFSLLLWFPAFLPGDVTWGFYAHKKINRLAVFTLPPEMIGFYKKNIQYIAEASVGPDRRRYAVVDEASRHYIDLDYYGDSAVYWFPRYWDEAVERYSGDTLKKHGVLPWHVNIMYYRLREAFMVGDPERILKLSAEIGHYIADAHVPLHTTRNYDGQLTGQQGIHGFWESRLPELFSDDYNFFVGRASVIQHPQLAIWKAIESSHAAVDSVLAFERMLALEMKEKKYSFEEKGRSAQRVFSQEYSQTYHQLLAGMVERRMRASVKLIGDFWFTAWVEAGQPDMRKWIDHRPTEEELRQRREDLKALKKESGEQHTHEFRDN